MSQRAPADAGRFEEILSRALPYLQTRHNEPHTLVSRTYAERLLKVEGGDPDVVIPAILLHDVGWSRVPEDQQLAAFGPDVKDPELTKVHERQGAVLAGEILDDLGWPPPLRSTIMHIISGHDTRVGSGSVSESVVRDADKLWRFHRRGFAIDCERFRKDPAPYLSWIEEQAVRWFFTKTGRELARQEIQARREELG